MWFQRRGVFRLNKRIGSGGCAVRKNAGSVRLRQDLFLQVDEQLSHRNQAKDRVERFELSALREVSNDYARFDLHKGLKPSLGRRQRHGTFRDEKVLEKSKVPHKRVIPFFRAP